MSNLSWDLRKVTTGATGFAATMRSKRLPEGFRAEVEPEALTEDDGGKHLLSRRERRMGRAIAALVRPSRLHDQREVNRSKELPAISARARAESGGALCRPYRAGLKENRGVNDPPPGSAS